ncbi:MAG: 3'(2'),5'-bisphosphate nucleotidase CysQ [Beijerinckiaceae bacterium]
MNDTAEYAALAAAIGEAARAAGAIALDFFEHGGKTRATVEYKDGGSPVSEADIAVDRFLHARLTALAPEAGWLSEESADDPVRLDKGRVFVVDPIDGTRAFINGDRRWGVAIALVGAGRPLAGVLYMPALDELYTAALGSGAARNGLAIRASTQSTLGGARIAGPKKALDALTAKFSIEQEPRIPSLAYRLARVASGELDAALASTDAWDWDIAAADLIVREAGGSLTGLDGRPPQYNLPRPRHGILAAAGQGIHAPLMEALRAVVPANVSAPAPQAKTS